MVETVEATAIPVGSDNELVEKEEYNKEEAAAYLGVSIRSIENYRTKGRLSVKRYEKGKTFDIAIFDGDELKKLKAEMAGTRRVEPRKAESPIINAESSAMVKAESMKPAKAAKGESQGNGGGLVKYEKGELVSAGKGTRKDEQSGGVAAYDVRFSIAPMMLNIDEASTLTRISKKELIKAIKEGLLKGKFHGRGYKVRPDDLQSYVNQLW